MLSNMDEESMFQPLEPEDDDRQRRQQQQHQQLQSMEFQRYQQQQQQQQQMQLNESDSASSTKGAFQGGDGFGMLDYVDPFSSGGILASFGNDS